MTNYNTPIGVSTQETTGLRSQTTSMQSNSLLSQSNILELTPPEVCIGKTYAETAYINRWKQFYQCWNNPKQPNKPVYENNPNPSPTSETSRT